ncbi:MAG TPA: pyridoxamine 5'-phosphate oxidase [Verrucomicrobiae bacterium]|jgi:pyridoxamine 5'-phosphate oxidase|nr:pyridoxamine 5'-phosphate oxidase [Verrucomicrobiae bacterium]
MTLADLRREYTLAGLRRADVLADPLQQFEKWLKDAVEANVFEANATSLATAGSSGQPTVRTVLLKGIDARGLIFFTNYESRKGRDLAENPRASLLVYWRELERQIITCGTVTKAPRAESEAYFKSRPPGSRLAAWASAQSQVIPDRAFLEAKLAEATARFAGQEVPTPPHWGGYILAPETVEFWQGRVSRLHDRIRYRRAGEAWKIERLSP